MKLIFKQTKKKFCTYQQVTIVLLNPKLFLFIFLYAVVTTVKSVSSIEVKIGISMNILVLCTVIILNVYIAEVGNFFTVKKPGKPGNIKSQQHRNILSSAKL